VGIPEGLAIRDGYVFMRNGSWGDEEDSVVTKGVNGSLYTLSPIENTSQIWLYGSTDPSYGSFRVEFNNKTIVVSSWSREHKTRQLLYVSEKVEWGSHPLILRQIGSERFGIHSLVWIDNHEAGMFELETTTVRVYGGEEFKVKVKRSGGSRGRTSVLFETWPGTALPGKNYREVSTELIFEDKETEKSVKIEISPISTRSIGKKGEVMFKCRLVEGKGEGIVGFKDSCRVEICVRKGLSGGEIGGIAAGAGVVLICAVVVSFVVMRGGGSVGVSKESLIG
jgi:hypothetical protein